MYIRVYKFFLNFYRNVLPKFYSIVRCAFLLSPHVYSFLNCFIHVWLFKPISFKLRCLLHTLWFQYLYMFIFAGGGGVSDLEELKKLRWNPKESSDSSELVFSLQSRVSNRTNRFLDFNFWLSVNRKMFRNT